jgi:hypothetical protein
MYVGLLVKGQLLISDFYYDRNLSINFGIKKFPILNFREIRSAVLKLLDADRQKDRHDDAKNRNFAPLRCEYGKNSFVIPVWKYYN